MLSTGELGFEDVFVGVRVPDSDDVEMICSEGRLDSLAAKEVSDVKSRLGKSCFLSSEEVSDDPIVVSFGLLLVSRSEEASSSISIFPSSSSSSSEISSIGLLGFFSGTAGTGVTLGLVTGDNLGAIMVALDDLPSLDSLDSVDEDFNFFLGLLSSDSKDDLVDLDVGSMSS